MINMGKIKDLYRDNIYGVIGTLLFHIIIFLFLIYSDLEKSGEVKEEAIMIDMVELPPELPKENIKKQPERSKQSRSNSTSNRASQRERSRAKSEKDPYRADDYSDEIAKAKALASSVSNNLSKKTEELNNPDNPELTDKDPNRDAGKQKITEYTGDSNINYNLLNRQLVFTPTPIYLTQVGSTVTVQISVTRSGKVTKAVVVASSANNREHEKYAVEAALKARFSSSTSAEEPQIGTISYRFIAQ